MTVRRKESALPQRNHHARANGGEANPVLEGSHFLRAERSGRQNRNKKGLSPAAAPERRVLFVLF